MKRFILLTVLFVSLLISVQATKSEVTGIPVRSESAAKAPKIQVAILLDTSGSMQGLIEQAKSRLWHIVNTLTTLKYKGKTPHVEIALYEYGSYHRYNGDFIRQITPLTTDLDLISRELFALTTGGSDEYCGTVISRAVKELEWGRDEADMKLIYIAGNEVFEQGSISYKVAIPDAVEKNIYTNTIHCGDRSTGIRDLWKKAADLGEGMFFNIDANRMVRYFETPYDDRIDHLNQLLNDTYIGYGRMGAERKMLQAEQDQNAKSISVANYAERAVSKSKAIYNNSSWDLIDKVSQDKNALKEIKKEELPQELQALSTSELQAYVQDKSAKRDSLQSKIADLAVQRQEYIDKRLKKEGEPGDDLGHAITQSLIGFAQQKGYEIPAISK
ncbi:hypothetical protein M2480_002668 [Parabacteroides sp. PFB2-12]|uniref:vWA domain-containing protein n=1 Tax=unclassified Parabacteroides TaxID=2649774 RepID=UPI002476EC12|nr:MULTISPECIES: VWA domain-containing protein [unclassified Parabacteroides]MDH6343973.1 hypothetical protein [Parabacteroides sp. PM6-13]MDH6391666.1 hypothetical protein [Parabacteroides sp. PFB2-12]